jgi:alanyl-tRNA synthetase
MSKTPKKSLDFAICSYESIGSGIYRMEGVTGNNANELIKEAARLTNGSGGGRPNFAQGGTQHIALIADAIEKIKEML